MDDLILISLKKLREQIDHFPSLDAEDQWEVIAALALSAAMEVAWHPVRKKKPEYGQHIYVGEIKRSDDGLAFDYHPAVVGQDDSYDHRMMVWPDDEDGWCHLDHYDLWCRRFIHRPPPASEAVLEHALRLREQDAE